MVRNTGEAATLEVWCFQGRALAAPLPCSPVPPPLLDPSANWSTPDPSFFFSPGGLKAAKHRNKYCLRRTLCPELGEAPTGNYCQNHSNLIW